jgi:hypothetical protein
MKKEFEEEINELYPFLADLKKQQRQEPFRTPRLYFDTLADKVLDKAKTETKVAIGPPQYKAVQTPINRITNWLSTIFEPKMALSALTLVLVLGAGWYVINQQDTKTVGNIDTDVVTREDVHNYINEHIDEFKEEEILLAFADIKPNKVAENEAEIKIVEPVLPTPNVQKTPLEPIHPKSGLTEEELEEYLKENLKDDDLDPS